MNTAGLIFSNIHDKAIPEMTRKRTMASIPYGCRYRMIDFVLSNMVNSDITTVGVITHYNYQSLLDHIGTGKDWDLSRRSGGIKILPPYVAAYENTASGKLYTGRLEALMNAENFLHRCQADYIVLSDCDVIMNIDLKPVIDEHIRTGAYMTVVTKHLEADEITPDKTLDEVTVNADGRIVGFDRLSKEEGKGADINTNVMVVSTQDLLTVISDSIANGFTDFGKDVISANLESRLFMAYRYDGFLSCIGSLESYFRSSMKLLTQEAKYGLFTCPNRPIYTKLRNSAPTKYAEDAVVKNCLLADGCVIEGTVENSIVFRGVHVGKGSVVRNCILLQDTVVGDGVNLNCVITDKDVLIKDGRMLSGHETMPFFIGKGMMV